MRGGKREGAGRPRKKESEKVKLAAFSIKWPEEKVLLIKEKAKAANLSLSKYIEKCCL